MTVRETEQGQLLVFQDGEHRLAQSFARFHRENPHVYGALVELARRWIATHPDRVCGIGMLYEVARWKLALRTRGEPLALNNNYRAFYARLMMERERELESVFRTRRQRG